MTMSKYVLLLSLLYVIFGFDSLLVLQPSLTMRNILVLVKRRYKDDFLAFKHKEENVSNMVGVFKRNVLDKFRLWDVRPNCKYCTRWIDVWSKIL